jgi:hypothetical protein
VRKPVDKSAFIRAGVHRIFEQLTQAKGAMMRGKTSAIVHVSNAGWIYE